MAAEITAFRLLFQKIFLRRGLETGAEERNLFGHVLQVTAKGLEFLALIALLVSILLSSLVRFFTTAINSSRASYSETVGQTLRRAQRETLDPYNLFQLLLYESYPNILFIPQEQLHPLLHVKLLKLGAFSNKIPFENENDRNTKSNVPPRLSTGGCYPRASDPVVKTTHRSAANLRSFGSLAVRSKRFKPDHDISPGTLVSFNWGERLFTQPPDSANEDDELNQYAAGSEQKRSFQHSLRHQPSAGNAQIPLDEAQPPPRAPPPLVPAPPGNDLSVEASPAPDLLRAAPEQTSPAVRCLGRSPKWYGVRRNSSKPSRCLHKSLPPVGRNQHNAQSQQGLTERFEDRLTAGRRHRSSSSGIRGYPNANEIVEVAGEPSRGKRGRSSPTQPIGFASHGAPSRINKPDSRKPSSESEATSDDEEQDGRDPDPGSAGDLPPEIKTQTSRVSMSNDVEHDSDMKGKIKALKSRRFKNPEERWHHYYGLFLNPAVAHQDEPQPYWLSHVSRGPSDHLQHYLDTRITEHPDEAIFLHRYTSLKERRQHRIKSVELHFEQKKITERLKIEAEYDKEVDALLSQVKKHRAGMVAEQQRPTDAATADLTIGQQEGQDQVLLHTVGNSTEMNMLKLHETTSDVAGSAATGSHGFNVQLDHYRRQVQTYPPIISDIPEATDQNLNYAGQHMAKLLEFVEDAETAANYPDTDTYPAESSGTHNHNVNVQQFGLQAQSQHDKLPPRMAQGDSTYGTLFLPNENPRYFPHGPGTFTEMTSQSLDIDDENYGGWYSQYTNSQDDTR